MGTNSTYFFQPGIPARNNPLTPKKNFELTTEMSLYHAKALDKIGSLYMTEEGFDDFYMGKGSTYPDLHGSVGILFEQASSRGHRQDSPNGELTVSVYDSKSCDNVIIQFDGDSRYEGKVDCV